MLLDFAHSGMHPAEVPMKESLRRRRRSSLLSSRHFTQAPSNSRIPNARPPPGRRRRAAAGSTDSRQEYAKCLRLSTWLLVLILLFGSISVTAAIPHTPRHAHVVARENDILFDAGPASGIDAPLLHHRQLDLGSSTAHTSPTSTKKDSTTKPASPTAAATSSSGSAPEASSIAPPLSTDSSGSNSSSPTSIEAAPTPTQTSLPKAFDGGMGDNFTQPSCPNFISQMANNETFTSCLPFSLLLQNSVSFFQDSRSSSTLDPVLTASCNIVFPACSALMSSYALSLRSSTACGDDYNRQNPTVLQAYDGLVSYDALYHAACLKSNTSAPASPSSSTSSSSSSDTASTANEYCFTLAVTNTSSPTDSYIYYLPLGVALPPGSLPTCSPCLKTTMTLFSQSAANKSAPLAQTYASAAQAVNLNCGPSFVPSAPAGSTGGSAGSKSGASTIHPHRPAGARMMTIFAVLVGLVGIWI